MHSDPLWTSPRRLISGALAANFQHPLKVPNADPFSVALTFAVEGNEAGVLAGAQFLRWLPRPEVLKLPSTKTLILALTNSGGNLALEYLAPLALNARFRKLAPDTDALNTLRECLNEDHGMLCFQALFALDGIYFEGAIQTYVNMFEVDETLTITYNESKKSFSKRELAVIACGRLLDEMTPEQRNRCVSEIRKIKAPEQFQAAVGASEYYSLDQRHTLSTLFKDVVMLSTVEHVEQELNLSGLFDKDLKNVSQDRYGAALLAAHIELNGRILEARKICLDREIQCVSSKKMKRQFNEARQNTEAKMLEMILDTNPEKFARRFFAASAIGRSTPCDAVFELLASDTKADRIVAAAALWGRTLTDGQKRLIEGIALQENRPSSALAWVVLGSCEGPLGALPSERGNFDLRQRCSYSSRMNDYAFRAGAFEQENGVDLLLHHFVYGRFPWSSAQQFQESLAYDVHFIPRALEQLATTNKDAPILNESNAAIRSVDYGIRKGRYNTCAWWVACGTTVAAAAVAAAGWSALTISMSLSSRIGVPIAAVLALNTCLLALPLERRLTQSIINRFDRR